MRADVSTSAWTSDPQPFPEAYCQHVGQAKLGTLRFREEQRGWSRAPELPCEGMGYEKAKKIGPPALRKHLTPPCWALYGQAAVCGPDTSPIVYQSEVTLLMSKVDKYIGVALD